MTKLRSIKTIYLVIVAISILFTAIIGCKKYDSELQKKIIIEQAKDNFFNTSHITDTLVKEVSAALKNQKG